MWSQSYKNCSLLWSFLYKSKQNDPFYFLYRIASWICTTPLAQNIRYLTLPSDGKKDARSLGSPNCLRQKEKIPNQWNADLHIRSSNSSSKKLRKRPSYERVSHWCKSGARHLCEPVWENSRLIVPVLSRLNSIMVAIWAYYCLHWTAGGAVKSDGAVGNLQFTVAGKASRTLKT